MENIVFGLFKHETKYDFHDQKTHLENHFLTKITPRSWLTNLWAVTGWSQFQQAIFVEIQWAVTSQLAAYLLPVIIFQKYDN